MRHLKAISMEANIPHEFIDVNKLEPFLHVYKDILKHNSFILESSPYIPIINY